MFNEKKLRKELDGFRNMFDYDWMLETLVKFAGNLEMIYPKNIFDRSSKNIELIAYKNRNIYISSFNEDEQCIEIDKIERYKVDYLKIKQYSGVSSINGNLILEIHLENGEVIILDSKKDSNNSFVKDYEEFIMEIIKNSQ